MKRFSGLIGAGLLSLLLIPILLVFLILGASSSPETGGLPVPVFEPTSNDEGSVNDPLSPLDVRINWTWFYATLLTIVIASLIIAGVMYIKRPRLGPDHFVTSDPEPEENHAFQQYLDELLQDQDPIRAVRLAFLAAETKIEHLPSREKNETPFEWSNRVGKQRNYLAQPLQSLCNYYSAARFASGQTTATDRYEAVEDLRQLHHLSHTIVAPVDLTPKLVWAS